MEGLIDITEQEFRRISELVYSRFGIHLTDKKKALVRGRLNSLIKELGFSSFSEYYNALISDKTGESLVPLIDRISTNHTYFFREKDHFDFLEKQILPEVPKDLRLWCAGCATGEEAYTLAMILMEEARRSGNYSLPAILATDISVAALNTASQGIYTSERIVQLPESYRNRYFKFLDKEQYQISGDLKRMILFKSLNLMDAGYPFKRKFHIVFCRNVMIYFDSPTKMELIKKIGKYMEEGGYLFIGHSESLGRDAPGFKYIRPAVYKRVTEPGI